MSSLSESQPVIPLANGLSMPVCGLGTWKSPEGKVKAAVKTAIEYGYRHIDCAAIYGNEHEVGEALAEVSVPRSSLWITSKLWNTMHAAEDVPKALDKTLADLGLDYVDLYLIHWPVTGNEGPEVTPSIEETWKAMEQEFRKGRAKAIGVSNFSAAKIRAMSTYWTIPPAVNQIELHPLWRQDALVKECAIMGIHCTAYSPLGSPDSAAMIKHEGASVMEHPVVKQVAADLDTTPAKVLIKWAITRGTSVLPKSTTPERIRANFDSLLLELSEDHMDKLCSIEPQMRMLHGNFWLKPAGPYKTLADLWDE